MTRQGQSTRREILTRSLALIGAGAMVLGSARWSAPAAAQDEGLGAGGRQGGDDGGGRRRRRDDAAAPDGIGGGGRTTTDPTVMAMPKTGAGVVEDAAASLTEGAVPLLLVAGAVGAASLALKTRPRPAATSRD